MRTKKRYGPLYRRENKVGGEIERFESFDSLFKEKYFYLSPTMRISIKRSNITCPLFDHLRIIYEDSHPNVCREYVILSKISPDNRILSCLI